jgi:hypothetical protein
MSHNWTSVHRPVSTDNLLLSAAVHAIDPFHKLYIDARSRNPQILQRPRSNYPRLRFDRSTIAAWSHDKTNPDAVREGSKLVLTNPGHLDQMEPKPCRMDLGYRA